ALQAAQGVAQRVAEFAGAVDDPQYVALAERLAQVEAAFDQAGAVQADVFAPAGALAAADVDAQFQAGQRSAFVVARGDLAADAPGVCAAAAPHIDVLQHARALRLRRRQFRGHLRGEYRGAVQRGVDAAGGEVAADLHALS